MMNLWNNDHIKSGLSDLQSRQQLLKEDYCGRREKP
jgi:hypothetical protein